MTVDRHEWYAPPLIYTRNDRTGSWSVQLALPSEAALLKSSVRGPGNIIPCAVVSNGKPDLSQNVLQSSGEGWVDGSARMQGNDDGSFGDTDVSEEPNTSRKRRRAEEASVAEGGIIANVGLHAVKEIMMVPPTVESVDLSDGRDIVTNASVAEQAIEPTLVMFEVKKTLFCEI